MMKRYLSIITILLAGIISAKAQPTGQLPSGFFWANPGATQNVARPANITDMLDVSTSSTRGAVLTRQNTLWRGLAPGTAGLPLLSGGAGADLAYGLLGLSAGGTNANLTASNGGIFYSTASGGAILAGTATAGQHLQSGSSAAPSWSTNTWPNTAVQGSILNAITPNTLSATSTPILGISGTTTGTLRFGGATSGTVTLTPQAAAGTPTLTFPTGSGTFAISAAAPLSLSATTGALTLPGTAGQVLAGATPAFTATPTLGANGGTGGSLTFAGSTSGSAVISVAAAAGSVSLQLPTTNGSTGYALTTNGSGVLSWSAVSGGPIQVTRQVFTGSGSYTPTSGTDYAIIECIGGGGGGAGVTGAVGYLLTGSGGGFGSYSRALVDAATIGFSQVVTVGAGGAGSSGANGANGTASSVGSLCVANGGGGATLVSTVQISQPGSGGTAGTGNIVASPGGIGGSGFLCVCTSSVQMYSGAGGSSHFGGGAIGVWTATSLAGNNAAGYGSGGSGGYVANVATNVAGGNGSAGIVIITEFQN